MASEESAVPATTEAAAAGAATRTGQQALIGDEARDLKCVGINEAFTISERVRSFPDRMVYERKRGDPIYRPLRIYTLDPSVPRGEGGVATVNVPYEPLDIGPRGAVFEVDSTGPEKEKYTSVDLEHPMVLIRSGKEPSPTDAEFHQQMVYAVSSLVYYSFRKALGRDVIWSFARPDATRLRLQPHALAIDNAYYDAGEGAILFGHSPAGDHPSPNNLTHSIVFTSLSHDIVAHEVTHALIDGLRAHFTIPTRSDVLALHEGLADAVAVFQHFSYPTVLEQAIRRSGRDFDRDSLLGGLAQEFGFGMHHGGPLRTALDVKSATDVTPQYNDEDEEHRLGSVLLSAIFEAFSIVFRRKTERYVNLATGESGELPPGNLPSTLREVLAQQASKLASQFLSICVRAIDYCPPVDVTFGEYLRAMITADTDLVPDDKWRYREALIRAFRRRGVPLYDVPNLSEEALLWKAPRLRIERANELSFARLRFAGDPGRPAGPKELFRQACVLGQMVTREEAYMSEFGLAPPRKTDGDVIEAPQVESVRTSRRVGPDGQIAFDLIAEVTQCRHVVREGISIPFYGGSTIILDPNGDIRYVISKSVLNEKRLNDQLGFMKSVHGKLHWLRDGKRMAPERNPFKLVHAHKDSTAE